MLSSKGESEIISTDSDIGTSPSGTTYASQPSSPQQINLSTDNSPNCSIPDTNMYNFFMDSMYKKYPGNNYQSGGGGGGRSNESSSNEQDLIMRKDSLANHQQLKQCYLDVIDQLRDLTITSKKQIGKIYYLKYLYC